MLSLCQCLCSVRLSFLSTRLHPHRCFARKCCRLYYWCCCLLCSCSWALSFMPGLALLLVLLARRWLCLNCCLLCRRSSVDCSFLLLLLVRRLCCSWYLLFCVLNSLQRCCYLLWLQTLVRLRSLVFALEPPGSRVRGVCLRCLLAPLPGLNSGYLTAYVSLCAHIL